MQAISEDTRFLIRYYLRHLQSHVAVGNPRAVLTELTPGFVHASVSVLGSVGPLLDDLGRAIRIAIDADDFPAAYKFAFLRDTFAEGRRSAFLGTKAVLRARAGECEAAMQDVGSLGSADDQALVRAERLVRLWAESRQDAEDELRALTRLAGACTPETVELMAPRVADVCPKAAVALAALIPEPTALLEDHEIIKSVPTQGRCLWRIAVKVARHGPSAVRALSECISGSVERAVFVVAAASRQLHESPRLAVAELGRVLATLNDTTACEALRAVFVRYVLSCLPAMPERLIFEAYQVLFELEPLLPGTPDFCRAVDSAIQRFPDKWVLVGNALPDGHAKRFLLWRLATHGLGDLPSVASDAADMVSGMVRAQQVVASAKRNPAAAVSDLEAGFGRLGSAHVVAGLIDILQSQGLHAVESLASRAFRLWNRDKHGHALDASLVLLRSIVLFPCSIRTHIIEWCVRAIEREQVKSDSLEGQFSLGQILAEGFTRSSQNAAQYWTQLLRSFGREADRRTVATWLLEQLPCDQAVEMSGDLTTFHLWPAASEEDVASGTSLFLSETQVALLIALADRVVARPLAVTHLLRAAVQMTGSISDESDRKHAILTVLQSALRLDPDSFWACHAMAPGDPWTADLAVTQALRKILYRANVDVMDAFLRLHVEFLVSLAQYRESEKRKRYTNARLLAVRAYEVPPLGIAVESCPVQDTRWLDGVARVFRGCPRLTGVPAHDWALHGCSEVLPLIDWPFFVRIMRDATAGPVVRCGLSDEVIRRAALTRPEDPQALLADIGSLEQATEDSRADITSSAWRSLIAAAAAYMPDLCVTMFRATRFSFLEYLDLFAPKAEWPAALLGEVCELLGADGDARRTGERQAQLLAWVGASRAVPAELLDRIVQLAHSLEDTSDAVDIAEVLVKPLPNVSNAIFKEALRRAATQKDASAITRILRIYTAATATEREDALHAGSCAGQHGVHGKGNDVLDQAFLDVDEAARVLATISADDSDAADVLGTLVQRLALRNEQDVVTCLLRLGDHDDISRETKDLFAKLLIARGVNEATIQGPGPLQFLTDAQDRADAYCQLLRANGPGCDGLLWDAILRQIGSIPSAHDRWNVSRQLARHVRSIDFGRAMLAYRCALTDVGKLDSILEIAFAFAGLVDDLMALPAAEAVPVSELMLDIIAECQKRGGLWNGPDQVAQALVPPAIGLWTAHDPRAANVMNQAIGQFRLAREGARNTAFETTVAFCCRDILGQRGPDAARAFLDVVLAAAPGDLQPILADAVCLQLCKPWTDEEEPLSGYRITQKRLPENEMLLVQAILSACTPKVRALAHLAFSVTAWGQDDQVAREESSKALAVAESEERRLGDIDLRDICMVYALSHGRYGLLRSLELLTRRPGVLSEAFGYLTAIAVNSTDTPRHLIASMCGILLELVEYLPEADS